MSSLRRARGTHLEGRQHARQVETHHFATPPIPKTNNNAPGERAVYTISDSLAPQARAQAGEREPLELEAIALVLQAAKARQLLQFQGLDDVGRGLAGRRGREHLDVVQRGGGLARHGGRHATQLEQADGGLAGRGAHHGLTHTPHAATRGGASGGARGAAPRAEAGWRLHDAGARRLPEARVLREAGRLHLDAVAAAAAGGRGGRGTAAPPPEPRRGVRGELLLHDAARPRRRDAAPHHYREVRGRTRAGRGGAPAGVGLRRAAGCTGLKRPSERRCCGQRSVRRSHHHLAWSCETAG